MGWILHFCVPAVIVLGIVLFAFGARSGKFNLKCILAPGIALIGLLVIWMGMELGIKFPKSVVLETASRGASISILVAALVCSILGLIEYCKEHRLSSKRAGGRYAVVTALICGLSLSSILLSVYTKKNYGQGNFVKAFTMPKRYRIIDLGFQIRPPKYWMKVDGSRLKPTPALAFIRVHPALSFSVVVGKPGPETPATIEALVKLAQSQILAANSSAKFNEPLIATDPVSTVTTAILESQVIQRSSSFFYVHRLMISKGFTYQLITWGPANDPTPVRTESELAFNKFAVLR